MVARVKVRAAKIPLQKVTVVRWLSAECRVVLILAAFPYLSRNGKKVRFRPTKRDVVPPVAPVPHAPPADSGMTSRCPTPAAGREPEDGIPKHAPFAQPRLLRSRPGRRAGPVQTTTVGNRGSMTARRNQGVFITDSSRKGNRADGRLRSARLARFHFASFEMISSAMIPCALSPSGLPKSFCSSVVIWFTTLTTAPRSRSRS